MNKLQNLVVLNQTLSSDSKEVTLDSLMDLKINFSASTNDLVNNISTFITIIIPDAITEKEWNGEITLLKKWEKIKSQYGNRFIANFTNSAQNFIGSGFVEFSYSKNSNGETIETITGFIILCTTFNESWKLGDIKTYTNAVFSDFDIQTMKRNRPQYEYIEISSNT